MNPQGISQRLLERGRVLHRTRPHPAQFTDSGPANDLVNDLAGHPHAFVLACIMDQQISYKKAWQIPYEVQQRVGGFTMSRLARLSSRDISRIMSRPTRLHRFPQRMAGFLHKGIQHIQNHYGGDAGRIWEGSPSSAEIVRRFLEFAGVGQKIATMAANILAREFKIPMSDYYSIDISIDVHVRRVFARLGLVPKKAKNEELIYTARAIAPEFPGLLDLPAWDIGRTWCRAARPLCSRCYMHDLCPSAAGAA